MRIPASLLAATFVLAAASPTRRAAESPSRRAATGRIEGTVEISSTLALKRAPFRIYAEPGAGMTPPPPPKDPIAAELKNVVVYLEGDMGRAGELAPHGRMVQRDERFVPHVLPVLQGSTVDFPNDDDFYHNVFSLSAAAGAKGQGFDLGRYPKGQSRSVTFDRAGTVQVFCHIHSDMSGVVLVLSNPFFTTPDDSHHYAIEDVPEGDYTIVGWHERIRPITRRVHVAAGQTTTLDFNIPLPQGGR